MVLGCRAGSVVRWSASTAGPERQRARTAAGYSGRSRHSRRLVIALLTHCGDWMGSRKAGRYIIPAGALRWTGPLRLSVLR
ncbi:hypothetical protein NDU88_002293 [Pleurodeles waltl]|uniref:Uncharacterized protein n=1 Tax=Pleurodeles waltl TaxID=8319 RepID=A0AAV7VYY1_PLEWA|nr:hypothetical protein NDU88_002293 [Pleurodeles waltl]